MKKTVTWVLIADGGRARILAREAASYVSVLEADFVADNRSNQEINADRPGRSFDSHGVGRHAMEPSSDPQENNKREFARRVAEYLNSQRNEKGFERLIVIAAPQTLGHLRQHLSPAVQGAIAEDIPKDITKQSLHDLQKTLPDLIETIH